MSGLQDPPEDGDKGDDHKFNTSVPQVTSSGWLVRQECGHDTLQMVSCTEVRCHFSETLNKY